MTVLIIGENKHNSYVREYFTQKGMDVFDVSDVCTIRSVTGEVGNFRVDVREDDNGINSYCDIGFLILTEQPTSKPVEIDGLPSFPLYGEKKFDVPASTAVLDPAVFLLDYVCESPMSATISALNDALIFARKKRNVFYLSKFIRTAGRGIETLYREAREAGVTFIKYEDIEISADLDKDEFTFSLSHDEPVKLTAKTVYTDGGRDVGERFAYAVDKLNLTADKYGYLTIDTYFLTPALTSRRGVFHLTRDLVAERLDEGLDHIYSVMMSGVKNDNKGVPLTDIPSHGIAVIDGKKCVFCYNCYRACPHAALEPDSFESRMQCLSAACTGCGTCAGLCPANAITLEKETASKCKEIQKTLIVSCENSGGALLEDVEGINILTVPCGGLISVGQLSENLYSYGKIMAVVCPDDACRHFDGNKRACAQVKRLQDMLESARLSADKLKIVQASQAMPKITKEELISFINIR